jgi:hypothetical protein
MEFRMAEKKDPPILPNPRPKPQPTFDEKPHTGGRERVRKYEQPMVSDTYKPPTKPPKKG